jgi:spore coat polysaccharide biosynthesis protein SpsF (cytidylyltransferase family)
MINTQHKVLAIMQARMSSTRLPGKVLMELNGAPMLAYELTRLKRAKMVDKIVVATSDQSADDAIEAFCTSFGVDCFRGSLDDVLSRYAECAKKYPDYDVILRVTGDCPLIDPVLVDRVVTLFLEGEYDYASTIPSGKETFPDGMDAEVFTKKALLESTASAELQSEREHVTPHMRKSGAYRYGGVSADRDYSGYRLTVDNPEDFAVVRYCAEHLAPDAGYLDYVALLDAHPEVRGLSAHYVRNEGQIR